MGACTCFLLMEGGFVPEALKFTSGNGPKLGLRLEPVLASRKFTWRKFTRKFTSAGHSFRSVGGAWNDGIPLRIIENLAKYIGLAPQAT